MHFESAKKGPVRPQTGLFLVATEFGSKGQNRPQIYAPIPQGIIDDSKELTGRVRLSHGREINIPEAPSRMVQDIVETCKEL